MSLIRWNPTRELLAWPSELNSLQREMNNLFEDFFRPGLHNDATGLSLWMPAADIVEQENDYVMRLELPGIKKDDVKISLESNVITIRGEKKAHVEEKQANYHRAERTYGSFQRSFTLPTRVNAEKIEAVFQDGILTITLPKVEEARPKQIEVRVK